MERYKFCESDHQYYQNLLQPNNNTVKFQFVTPKTKKSRRKVVVDEDVTKKLDYYKHQLTVESFFPDSLCEVLELTPIRMPV
jgi:hypothetical protein